MSTAIPVSIQPAGSIRMEQAVRKFHTSLNVSNLRQSIAFYRELLGVEPAKVYDDYAKFELDEPPVVLSLVPHAPTHGGNLNHAGIRVRTSDELVQVQERLEKAGFRTRREEGVECCYALQTKFWVTDPDNVLWEIYVFHEDVEAHGHGSETHEATLRPDHALATAQVVWEHRITTPIPDRIPHDDNTVHEVRLEGTINLKAAKGHLQPLLNDALRVLRPGGVVRVHGLAGDRELTDALPPMPGPAAAVEHVPASATVVRKVEAAGFAEVRVETLSQRAYFTIADVPMRELAVVAKKPGFRPKTATHQAVYLGPLASVTDDFSNVFRRGEFTSVNVHDWQALADGPSANQFLLLKPETR